MHVASLSRFAFRFSKTVMYMLLIYFSGAEHCVTLQDLSNMPVITPVLVDHCLVQMTSDYYRLHDLVLEYLQLTLRIDPGDLAL